MTRIKIKDLDRKMVPPDWWDSRKHKSFFNDLYREVDDLLEDHLLDVTMTIEQRTIRECNMIEAITRPFKDDNIIDCPCGEGRHSIELAKRGYNVVGIDLDQKALLKAEKTSMKYDVQNKIKFVQADKKNLPLSNATYQIVINMFTSFGFFESDTDNLRVLQEFSRVLAPNGRLIIHTDINPARLEHGFHSNRSFKTFCGRRSLTITEKFNPINRCLEGLWSLFKNGKPIKQHSYSIRIYTHSELARMLRHSGFSRVEALTMEGTKLDAAPLSREVIYIAVKGPKS